MQQFVLGLAGISLALVLNGFLSSAPTFAAEEVVFRKGPFERSLPVQDLRTYAETQEASPQLKSLLRSFDSEDQATIQEFLQIKYPLNVVTVDRLIRTEFGQQFLSNAAKATIRRDDAGVQALRAALILGTRPPEGLGVISFLEAYPSQRLIVNLPQALNFVKSNYQILRRLGELQQPTTGKAPLKTF